MYLSYLWCSENIEPSQALHEFTRIINEQSEMYSAAWGFTADARIHQKDNVFIGHLSIDSGVVGWKSWHETGDGGVAWNGVCETFLGTEFSDRQIQNVYKTLSESTCNLSKWDGNYYLVSWRKEQDDIYLTTGATVSPTLWYTKGSRGWAAGSRGGPILEMVNRQIQLSTTACNIFMSYGYNYSDQSLFEHVQRIPQRTRVTVRPFTTPTLSRYSTLTEFIEPYSNYAGRNGALSNCADRLVERMRRQLKYSSNPEILITGGHDSRCIAAAAKQAGYSGDLSTGGPVNSTDMVIGKKVAQRLGMSHTQTPDRVPLAVFGKAAPRLELWSKMSEGLEVIRHALAYNRFITNQPTAENRQQLFHGLGGEIFRGYYYHNSGDPGPFKTTDYSLGRKLLLSAANPLAPLTREAKELLNARYDEFSHDLEGSGATVAQWLDMFFWQNSCLRWGCDMLSVKSTMYWPWTPLLDRELINRTWSLAPADKCSNSFVRDLALTLAGELEGLAYDVDTKRKRCRQSIYSRLFAKLRRMGNVATSTATDNREATQFWENFLLNTGHPIWVECLDETLIRKLIYTKPHSEQLWNAATIQLLHNAFR